MALSNEDIDQVQNMISQRLSFTNALFGDTPTDALQLTPKKFVDTQVSSVYSAFNILNLQGVPAVYGDSTDDTIILDGTTSYSFASIVSSSVYSQTRDIYATVATINDGISLKTNQWRIFASSVFTAHNSSILNKGPDASSAIGGNSILAGYYPSVAGGGGGGAAGNGVKNGQGGAGSPGVSGAPVIHSIGFTGANSRTASDLTGGTAGAQAGGMGGASALGGVATAAIIKPIPVWGVEYLLDVDSIGNTFKMTGSGGSASGPGGGGGGSLDPSFNSGNGGQGGGAGTAGGTVGIFARRLNLDPGSIIDVMGGRGGDGLAGQTPSITGGGQKGGGAGGNGGSGGNGGTIILGYNSASVNGTLLYSGGINGSGGSGGSGVEGGGTGATGRAGFSGASGSVLGFRFLS